MTQLNATFGALLRRHRLLAGFSQEELAERARVSVNAIGSLERGINHRPHPKTVAHLADALGLSPEERAAFVVVSRPDPPNESSQLAPAGAQRAEVSPVAPIPFNLPVSSTSFVGRDQDVAAVRERLLQPDVRLLTLTGPGGTGKTRLALEVAASLANAFADGVHFVDLAPLRDPALVHATIARTLGIRDAGDQPLLDTLRFFLQPRCLLLVLDNFEQLIDAAPLVADLLALCSALKIAVTSRERLHLSWEYEWPVPPLALPPTASVDRDLIVQSPAVRLFVERARAITPNFESTELNARSIADICVRLDGLPLAIELAAARVKLLPLAVIHARLQQRLVLLTGGPSDAPTRHHTLRAAMAWSYGLLDQEEQATFRQLAIFVGGFTIEAAEAVSAETRPDADRSSQTNILERLQSLVNKNLVRFDPNAAEPRFQMLETIREYGLEQLSVTGELEAIQEHHARFFLALAEEGERDLVVRMQGSWLDRLEADHDNVRAALDWSVSAPASAEIGPRLASAMAIFWWVRGHFSSGRAWYKRILDREGAAMPTTRIRVKVRWAAALLAWRQADYDAARVLSEQGIALGDGVNGPIEVADCFAVRGLVATDQADYAIAHSMLDRGLALYREAGNERNHAHVLGFCSILSYVEGDYARARSLGEESVRILRQRGEQWGIAMNLDTLGSVARRQGDYQRAQALHEESIAVSRAIGDREAMAVSLAHLGHLARAVGNDAIARSRYSESLRIYRELGDRRGTALALGNLGVLAEHADDLDKARDCLYESLSTGRSVGDKRIVAAALNQLARLDLARNDGPAAAAGYSKSLQLSADLKDKRGVARALEGCASGLGAAGQTGPAMELCALADALLDSLGVHRSPADQASYEDLRIRIHGAPASARLDSTHPGVGSLDLQQIVEHALALLDSKPAPPTRLRALSDREASPLTRR